LDLEHYEHRGDPDGENPPTSAQRRNQGQAEATRQLVQEAVAAAPAISTDAAGLLAAIFARTTPPIDLMRWRLHLYCGHVVDRAAHREHRTIDSAFALTSCPECGLNPATILAGRPLGLVEQSPQDALAVDDDMKGRE
jgi:hypothetical protein